MYHLVRQHVEANTENCFGIFTSGTNVYLCFRGTQSWDDWITNISFRPIKEINQEYGHHVGFYASIHNTYASIVEALLRIPQVATKTLYVTGHSKGGAEAHRFALVYHEDERPGLPTLTHVYTFAAPMIIRGNNQESSLEALVEIARKMTNFIHVQDPVPRLPGLLEDPKLTAKLIKSVAGDFNAAIRFAARWIHPQIGGFKSEVVKYWEPLCRQQIFIKENWNEICTGRERWKQLMFGDESNPLSFGIATHRMEASYEKVLKQQGFIR